MLSWGESCLYAGDNLQVLRSQIASASIDLTYLDPPFNSQADYHYEGGSTRRVAFTDHWLWDEASEATLTDLRLRHPGVVAYLETLIPLYGHNGLIAYLVMMAPRLLELRRVLRPHGTLYLHCDDSASHPLRGLLDLIFGREHFRAQIAWRRSDSKGSATTRYSRVHDSILCYSAGPRPRWNSQAQNLTDLWDDIPPLRAHNKERTGYPTQKPLALLRRIIEASSNPGDVVLDPFHGAGTTLVAAEQLGRRWVGIDLGADAQAVTRARLEALRLPTPPAGSLWARQAKGTR